MQRSTKSYITGIFVVLLLITIITLGVRELKKSQDSRKAASETAIEESPKKVGVLELAYFPPDPNDPTKLSSEITGGPSADIQEAKRLLVGKSQLLQEKLDLASKYHGYSTAQAQAFANPNAVQFLNYETIQKFEYDNAIPISQHHAWGKPNTYRPDYKKMMEEIDICSYVDNPDANERVRQVWVWGYHTDLVEPDESNMSMGRSSISYWNKSGYGDISNSEQIYDLPTCEHTYVLYNYSGLYTPENNFVSAVGYSLEDHTHHIERVLEWLDEPNDYNLWWKNFVGSSDRHDPFIRNPGCGWTHYTPNSDPQAGLAHNYNWYIEENKLSDCVDWKPDGTGQSVAVSCHTWAGETCSNDAGTSFKVWWMQSLPGYNNDLTFITYDQNGIQEKRELTNWWEAIYDLDGYIQTHGKSLTKSLDPANPITVTPTPAPSPIGTRPDISLTTNGFSETIISEQAQQLIIEIENTSSVDSGVSRLYFYDREYLHNFTITSTNDRVVCKKMTNAPLTTECTLGILSKNAKNTLEFSVVALPTLSEKSGNLEVYLQTPSDLDFSDNALALPYTIRPERSVAISSTLPKQLLSGELYNFRIQVTNNTDYSIQSPVLKIDFLDHTSVNLKGSGQCYKNGNAGNSLMCEMNGPLQPQATNTYLLSADLANTILRSEELGKVRLTFSGSTQGQASDITHDLEYKILARTITGTTELRLESNIPSKLFYDSSRFEFRIHNDSTHEARNLIFDINENSTTYMSLDPSNLGCKRIRQQNKPDMYRCEVSHLAAKSSIFLPYTLLSAEISPENGSLDFTTKITADNLDPGAPIIEQRFKINVFPNSADLNDDYTLTNADYDLLVENLFRDSSVGEYAKFDINKDGSIDLTDVRILTRQLL